MPLLQTHVLDWDRLLWGVRFPPHVCKSACMIGKISDLRGPMKSHCKRSIRIHCSLKHSGEQWCCNTTHQQQKRSIGTAATIHLLPGADISSRISVPWSGAFPHPLAIEAAPLLARMQFPLTFQAQNVQHELAQAAVGRLFGLKIEPIDSQQTALDFFLFWPKSVSPALLMLPRKHGREQTS